MKLPVEAYLSAAGAFQPIDLHFARLMCHLAGASASEELFLAAALASNVTLDEKHVCLDLAARAGTVWELSAAAATGQKDCLRLPELEQWVEKLKAASVVGEPGAYTPLVLDQRNRLYLYRYWLYEQQLAARLAARQRLPLRSVDSSTVNAVLRRYDQGPVQLDLFQKIAVIAALTRGLCVITGGPGTGKTFTVSVVLEILRCLAPDTTIRVCAPTGKAANRLQEALQRTSDDTTTFSDQPVATIHRLLGISQGSSKIRYAPENPLPADVVIVDEASMVPLALMAKLTAALSPHCRLVLLGDKDQLASVEAGSVLGDICAAFRINRFSPEFCSTFTMLTGQPIPNKYQEASGFLTDCAVELNCSHRFDPAAGIGALSSAVKEGDALRCREVIATDASAQISWHALPSRSELETRLSEIVRTWYVPLFSEPSPEAAYAWCTKFKILCAYRQGSYGVEGVTRVVEKILREHGITDAGRRLYQGRLVMVTQNDYTLHLFNGDIGIVWHTAAGDLAALFPDASGSFRTIPSARLPEHETAFAITIHKSQGSEFDRVLIILPEADSALLTRELVYTGITRARYHVELWVSPEVLESAIRKRFLRASGLCDALLSTVCT